MPKWSFKKEIKPQGTKTTGKPSYGALISFSGMKAALALFSQPGAFGSFVGTKEQRDSIPAINYQWYDKSQIPRLS
ncbi:hypothetical protein [Gracilimonas sp.]|uniref:hypothetical protein n=1 Tax=Gracilimonas sp. TaxID=1974203 RepID=UPI002870CA73|nr:hypothetical protein [Gracilimonas sp.]